MWKGLGTCVAWGLSVSTLITLLIVPVMYCVFPGNGLKKKRKAELKAMKALAAPFPQIKFIPTGGVNRDNLDEFLSWEKIYAVGGSFMVEEALKNA